jgi:hypothetical protein
LILVWSRPYLERSDPKFFEIYAVSSTTKTTETTEPQKKVYFSMMNIICGYFVHDYRIRDELIV